MLSALHAQSGTIPQTWHGSLQESEHQGQSKIKGQNQIITKFEGPNHFNFKNDFSTWGPEFSFTVNNVAHTCRWASCGHFAPKKRSLNWVCEFVGWFPWSLCSIIWFCPNSWFCPNCTLAQKVNWWGLRYVLQQCDQRTACTIQLGSFDTGLSTQQYSTIALLWARVEMPVMWRTIMPPQCALRRFGQPHIDGGYRWCLLKYSAMCVTARVVAWSHTANTDDLFGHLMLSLHTPPHTARDVSTRVSSTVPRYPKEIKRTCTTAKHCIRIKRS